MRQIFWATEGDIGRRDSCGVEKGCYPVLPPRPRSVIKHPEVCIKISCGSYCLSFIIINILPLPLHLLLTNISCHLLQFCVLTLPTVYVNSESRICPSIPLSATRADDTRIRPYDKPNILVLEMLSGEISRILSLALLSTFDSLCHTHTLVSGNRVKHSSLLKPRRRIRRGRNRNNQICPHFLQ